MFLSELFHLWVRWEGTGSGFERSSAGVGAGGAGCVRKYVIFENPISFLGMTMGPGHTCDFSKHMFL